MRILFLLLTLSVLSVSCDKSDSKTGCPEPQLNCSGVSCLLHSYNFDFRVVDRNTQADLVFGANPRYTTADVTLYSDAAHTQSIPLTVDNGARLFKTTFAGTEMYLVIAGTTNYKITTNFKAVDCCASRVKDLSVNNQSVCTCCADAIEIPVD